MESRISHLLRTNTALILLCLISIGVLYILINQRNRNSAAVTHQIRETTSFSEDIVVDSDPLARLPASSPLKHAPAPTAMLSFVFHGEASTTISFVCSDTYTVALIYPSTIDYRLNPLSSLYNRAIPCNPRTASSTRVVAFENLHLDAGSTYYIVRAHQGKKGSWHDPY